MMHLTSRETLALCLTCLLAGIATPSTAQNVQNRPWQSAPAADAPPSPSRPVIVSRPFAHPTPPIAADSPATASDASQTERASEGVPPSPAYWKKLIRLIRRNAKLEAALETAQAIAEIELRAAEEKRANLQEVNDNLRERIKQLEQEVDQAEQEMRERSIHAAHMERQMMQRSELIEELERQLLQARRERSP